MSVFTTASCTGQAVATGTTTNLQPFAFDAPGSNGTEFLVLDDAGALCRADSAIPTRSVAAGDANPTVAEVAADLLGPLLFVQGNRVDSIASIIPLMTLAFPTSVGTTPDTRVSNIASASQAAQAPFQTSTDVEFGVTYNVFTQRDDQSRTALFNMITGQQKTVHLPVGDTQVCAATTSPFCLHFVLPRFVLRNQGRCPITRTRT